MRSHSVCTFLQKNKTKTNSISPQMEHLRHIILHALHKADSIVTSPTRAQKHHVSLRPILACKHLRALSAPYRALQRARSVMPRASDRPSLCAVRLPQTRRPSARLSPIVRAGVVRGMRRKSPGSACTGYPSRLLHARSAAVLSGTSCRLLNYSAFLTGRNSWRLRLTVILESVSKR